MCVRVHICVCVYVCVYVCLYVCVRSCAYGCVCVLTCIYACLHASTDVYYMRTIHVGPFINVLFVYYMCTIQVRPYIYVACDDYVLGPCRAKRTGSQEPQGSALAAASSALRRLHSLQLFLM